MRLPQAGQHWKTQLITITASKRARHWVESGWAHPQTTYNTWANAQLQVLSSKCSYCQQKSSVAENKGLETWETGKGHVSEHNTAGAWIATKICSLQTLQILLI